MPTKSELLEQAWALGIDVTEENTKAEIEEAMAQHLEEVPVEADTATPSKVCANCGDPAVVTVGGRVNNEVSFCGRHIPKGVLL